MLSSSKEKFHHKFIDVGPIENLKLAVKGSIGKTMKINWNLEVSRIY